ncbi:MAG: glycosyltransferase [Planctomycetota bacterium]|nr:MAG: glycosyltransferase [Planctomycetota bacterium]
MTGARPRILYIASHCPAGPDFGARLRVRHVGRLLRGVGDVTLLLVSAGDWPDEWLDEARADFDLAGVIRMRHADAWPTRLRRSIDPAFLNTHGFAITPTDRATIVGLIREHDAAWVHTVRTANATGLRRWPGAVLDVDDLPSQLESTRAAGLTGAARARARWRAAMWGVRERRLLSRFAALAVCSDADRRRLGGAERIGVVPNGFDRPAPVPRRPASPPRFGFIGTLEYGPNLDGVRWFVDRAWPTVRAAHPSATLRLVGAGSDAGAVAGPGVEGLGYVDDPGEEIATWTAMVVPVRAGGGTRVKIAEAFARGCPVVATPIGAFGYDAEHGRHVLLADTPEGLAGACARLIDEPGLGARLADHAAALYESKYTWEASAPVVADLIARAARRDALAAQAAVAERAAGAAA